MNFAQEKAGSSRLTGIGVVILIHVLIVYALASGLATKIKEAVKGPIDVKIVEEKIKPPPPPDKVIPPPPDIKAPPPPFVPPPEVVVTAPPPPTPTVVAQSVTPPPPQEFRPTPQPAPAPPAPARPAGPAKAAANCTKMGKPELPAINWSGSASYKATFTVKAGRVASYELTPLRSANDRKADRALRNAIALALQETYECPGDHILEQEFVFNVDG